MNSDERRGAPVWKKVLAWMGAIVGGFAVVAALSDLAQGEFRKAVAVLLVGVASLLAGAWWLRCEKADRKAFAEYETARTESERLAGPLREEDALVAEGLALVSAPPPVNRRWKLVGTAAAVCAVAALVTAPPAETKQPATPSPVVGTAERTATTTTVERAAAPEPSASESSTPTSSTPESPVAATPPQAEAQASTRAPTSPASSTVYYSNCREARAAGAAPLRRGEPGYRPGLDGDGDGVACERT